MLTKSRLGSLLTVGVAAVLSAGAGGDAAPGDILRAAQAARPGSAAPLPRHPAPALRLLADTRSLPAGDLTPLLVQALRQPRLLDAASREALDVLLTPPPLRAPQVAVAGNLRVHYEAASAHDAPASPGSLSPRVAAALEGMVDAQRVGARAGLRAPVGGDGFDLYLAPLGGRVVGYTAPRPDDDPTDGWGAFAVLDPASVASPAEVRALAGRLYGRAIGFAYRPLAPAWWSEPAAFWFEDRVSGTRDRYEPHVAHRRQHPEEGLLAPELGRALGNLDLFRTLDPDGDARQVRRTWETASSRPDLPLVEALDIATRGDRPAGAGLDRILADLMVRAAAETDRGDGAPLRLAAHHTTYPVAAIDTVAPVEPLGASVVLFEADDEDGGLRLRLESASRDWGAELLLRRRDGHGFVRAPLSLDEDGGGEIGLPWADFDRALLLVRNAATAGPAERYSYTATPESRYPFALSAVDVHREAEGRRVAWQTAQERDMFGWLVFRGATAEGPWVSLTPVPLPALGTRDEPAVYEIVDEASHADADDAHYRVVGVTRDGLTRAVDAGRADR